MGKRSNFKRIEKDFYRTFDKKAYFPLSFFPKMNFYEPCDGEGDLRNNLEGLGWNCVGYSDISSGKNALDLTIDNLGNKCDIIVTNPPWTRSLLHPLINHFITLKPTLLLFDSDWAYTKQAIPYIVYCKYILPVGRLKWIPDTNMSGKDNCSWYYFDIDNKSFPKFIVENRD